MIIPTSYGPAPKNSDSAVNILLDVVQDQSGKTYKMDDYAQRYPTNVLDVASFLVRLSGKCPILPLTCFLHDWDRFGRGYPPSHTLFRG